MIKLAYMNYVQAVFLAIVQGLTEFLPVSSSGHLVILQKLLDFSQPPVIFDILVHVGTLGAILFYFKKQLISILKGIFKKKDAELKIFYFVLIGSLPAGVIGFFLQHYIEQIFDSLRLVGFSLLITAGILFSSKFIKAPGKDFKYLNWKNTLFIGFFQALAILPGVSRSGSTIISGLWQDFKRETAFLFSFYLAIPAILGALVLQIPDLFSQAGADFSKGLLGMIVAGIVGYFSLSILERTLKSAKLHWLGLYCLILGLIVLIV
jgi:undecaprenyl-diphosphatase